MTPTVELTTAQVMKYRITPTLRKGGYGKVFRYDEERAIKIFHKPEDIPVDNIEKLMFSYQNISTPQTFVTYKSEILGYLMAWGIGKKIYYINDANFYYFVEALKRTYNDIFDISYKGIKFWDCNKKNILYGETKNMGKFTIGDTEFWIFADESYDKILEYNLKEFNASILENIICLRSLTLNSFAMQEVGLENIWHVQDLSTYLQTLKEEVEKYTNKRVRRLSDLDRFLR